MFLKLLLLVLNWTNIHANSKFNAQKFIEVQQRKQVNILSTRKLQSSDQQFDNVLCIDQTCFDANLPDYNDPIYPMIWIGESSWVPIQIQKDSSLADEIATLDQMYIQTDDSTYYTVTAQIEFTNEPTSTQYCLLDVCYEIALYDINSEIVDDSSANQEKTYSVICIGDDCLTAQEISQGAGKVSTENVFWLSGRSFIPNEPVTDGSNSIGNFSLSDTTFCFNDDTDCFDPVKRIPSDQDAGPDDITRGFGGYWWIVTLQKSNNIQLDVGQLFLCIENSCMIAQNITFKKALESFETIIWIEETPYQAITALDELPQPATVFGTFNQTLLCPANNVDCYTLLSLSDQTSIDNNITCWQSYCFNTQIYEEPEFQNSNLTICIDQICFIGYRINFTESQNDESNTQFYIAPNNYIIIDKFQEANIGDVVTTINSTNPRVEIWLNEDNQINGYWPTKFIKDPKKQKNQTVRCLFDVCFTADIINENTFIIQFDGLQVFAVEVSWDQGYFNKENIIIWNKSTPYLFLFQTDGYANPDIYLNLTDLVVCFGNKGCFLNLQTIDESSFTDDSICFYDESMDSIMTPQVFNPSCVSGIQQQILSTIVNLDGLTFLTDKKSFFEGLNYQGDVIWSGLTPYIIIDQVNSSQFDIRLQVNSTQYCSFEQYECRFNYKRIILKNTSTNNSTVQCFNNQCYRFSSFNDYIPQYFYTNQIPVCIDEVCFTASLTTDSSALRTKQTLVWIENFNFIVQQPTNKASWDQIVTVSIKDYSGDNRIEVFPQGDDNGYWPVQWISDDEVAETKKNNTVGCLFKQSNCFIGELYALKELTIQLDDAGVKVYVQRLNISQAWASNETIIWDGLNSYQLIAVVDNLTETDLRLNVSDLTVCFGEDGCYYNLMRIQPNPDETSYKCIDDAQTVCFGGLSVPIHFEILGAYGYTYLANQLTFKEGWVSNNTIVWVGYTPYEVLQPIPNNDFFTIPVQIDEIVICLSSDNCYYNIQRLTEDSQSDGNNIYCLSDNVCWTYDIYNETEIIVQINNDQVIYQGLYYPKDNQTVEQYCSQAGFLWINQQAYLLGLPDLNGLDPDVVADLPDSQVQINCQFYNNLQKIDAEFETSKNQTKFCLSVDSCFSADLIQSDDTIDTAPQQVIQLDDIGVQIVVQQLKISEAWVSSEKIIWNGIDSYQFISLLDNETYTDLRLNLSDLSFCFGQDGCYYDLIRIEPVLYENETSYKCIDDAQAFCFTGTLDTSIYQILAGEGQSYLAKQLIFEEGWVSKNTIAWVGYTPYEILLPIPNNYFYTVAVQLDEVVICLSPDDCYNNFYRLPEGIQSDGNNIYCLSDNECWMYDIYKGTETIIQLVDNDQSYHGLYYLIDNQTVGDQCDQATILWINQQAYMMALPIMNHLDSDVVANLSDVVVEQKCLFYNNLTKVNVDYETQENQIKLCVVDDACFSADFSYTPLPEPLRPCDPISYNVQSALLGGKYAIDILGAQKDCYVDETGMDAQTYEEDTNQSYDSEFVLAEGSSIAFAPDLNNQQMKMRANFRDYFLYAITGVSTDPSSEGKCASECFQSADHCCASVIARHPDTGLTMTDTLCMNQRVAMTQLTITLADTTYRLKCGSNPDGYVSSAIAVQASAFLVSALLLVQSNI